MVVIIVLVVIVVLVIMVMVVVLVVNVMLSHGWGVVGRREDTDIQEKDQKHTGSLRGLLCRNVHHFLLIFFIRRLFSVVIMLVAM